MKRSSSKKPVEGSEDEGSGWSTVQAYVTEQEDLKQRPVQSKPSKSSILDDGPLREEPSEIPGQQTKEDDWETSSDEDDHTDDEHQVVAKAPNSSERSPLIPKLVKRTLPRRVLDALHDFQLTSIQKDVLKCAVSYLLASLFTFVPALSLFVGLPFDKYGPVANAHFVATISTYYNPAKSIGNMIEANLFMFWGLSISTIVCFASMAVAVVLDRAGHENIGHFIIVAFFLTGSSGVIAYFKLRVGKATFGSACSMCALIISIILCKEGAVHIGAFETDAILQMVFIVGIGVLISNFVCFTLWPGSAAAKLQGDINKTLDSFATLITMLARTFLLEEEMSTSVKHLKKAINAHEASFTGLKTSLADAKLELLDPRIQRSANEYDAIVKSMTRLAQNLTGLRSGCTLQNDILRARKQRRATLQSESGPKVNRLPEDFLSEPSEPSESLDRAGGVGHHVLEMRDPAEEQIQVFEQFKQSCGPSLKHLTNTARNALKELRTSFIHSRAAGSSSHRHGYQPSSYEGEVSQTARLRAMRADLKKALADFNLSHSRALKRLYRHYPTEDSSKPARGKTEEQEELDRSGKPAMEAKPNEAIFTIYFFLFAFEEFVRELDSLIEPFILVRQEEELLDARKHSLQSRFGSLLGWIIYLFTPQDQHDKPRWQVIKDRWNALFPWTSEPSPFPAFLIAEETVQSRRTTGRGWMASMRYRAWQMGAWMRSDEIKFAVKTGVGAGLLGLPAFVHQTRPLWKEYRGEWAMISYMVVASLQTGQSNFNAFFRIGGTLLGATCAVGIYRLFFERPVELAISGFFFAIPNFYLICAMPKYATTGRFILLSYNLTALYSYNRREQDLAISLVAFKRSIAVIVGTIWAWFISSYIWPYEARVQLRKSLADTFLRSAYLYERIVSLYSVPPPALTPVKQDIATKPDGEGMNGSILSQEGRDVMRKTVNDFAAMELHLQKQIIQMNGMLTQTSLEPRLKGPFPVAQYRQILNATQNILDQLHAIRTVTTRDEWLGNVRRDFILPVQKFRREMVGNILLYFSVLATTISIKAPLPPYLPPASAARLRLVEAIRELDVVKRRAVRGSSTYLLYFAYSLAMLNIVNNLDTIGRVVQELYGVVGGYQSINSFESLFAESNRHGTVEAANGVVDAHSKQSTESSEDSDSEEERRGRQ